MSRLVPKTFYSLREAVEEIGKHLFPDEWTGEEADARNLPPPDEGPRLIEERARLKMAAAEAGLRDHPPYDLLNPPPPAPNSGGGAGMPEPDTPLNRLRRRLWDTTGVEQWPEVGSSEYESERAAYLRWVGAEAELVEALREGFLMAVIQYWDGRRIDLFPERWRQPGTRYFTRSSKFEIRSYHKAPPQLLHCEIPAAWLRKLLSSGEVGATGSGVDPYHTGVGGHPTAIHFVHEEHKRRIGAGEVCSRVSDEARYLADWSKREHPKAPPLSARHIENAIRSRHNRWKSGGDTS